MSELKLSLEQIDVDAALIIVRLDNTRYPTVAQVEHLKEHLQRVSIEIGKPVMVVGHGQSIEQLNDEQLRGLGLQRIS